MTRTKSFVLATLFASLAATPAFAHVGDADHGGLMHGLMHPIGGLDHILAMVAVGVMAAQLGGRALWLLPLSFMGMMVAGGVMGFTGIDLPYVELGIALSVLVLGALVALDAKLPVAAAMAIAGGFAIFHGFAHGAELPAGSSPQEYAAGFVLATALLHVAGIGLGLALAKFAATPGDWITRLAGAATAAVGGMLASSS
ncbi:MAG: HupE/UreJ family protein [Hyphomicrobium sp.]